ncbi:hypothetical protein DH2020_010757 [Rehmannia glutinosa]|uniref:Uncharacterized protein n=1 Tax=Rehmannia glutinosa TaxID=99300 RepID=A0ABR0XBJ4_REHGL
MMESRRCKPFLVPREIQMKKKVRCFCVSTEETRECSVFSKPKREPKRRLSSYVLSSSSEGSVWKRKIKLGMDQEKDQTIRFFSTVQDRTVSSSKGRKIISRRKQDGIRYPLVSFHELPDYMKDNEYILNYYRADWPLKVAFLSLFRWHNETLNVWTHLLGFLLFVGLTVANLIDVPQLADFITMFTATTCHLFCCHSRKLNTHLLRMDYVGITVMIITSFFPPIYYIFQCTPHWQIVYLTGITIMGTCTVITLLSPALSSGKCRSFRACLFVSMGLFGLVPAVHALVANWNDPHRNITLAYESAMALSYLIGTVFYVSRVPERWRPGWFDLAGHSHQIFHVFVVMGALAHYGAALIFLRYRSRMGCDKID